ncbi:melanoma antigen preferentially expressed in tumors [Manis javanica]|uniref:melanoma antigen preferentially expressed in tumors n=1 Tax=Manis javanica TaxID=9974 RepID=UPI0018791E95|nr:melanoma antigen preferentially expressed in tumors [Manis javanica]KAI5929853.1 Melanoma antigen preferentially expressed in tumors [Manis javanica]
MSILVPARLLELAVQSLLRNEALAIAALEELPRELFPPLFTAAFLGRHSNVLRAMVQAWPFPCLPLGALMREQLSHQETFKAVLDGLDDLLAQEVCTRRGKLQVLDLQKNASQDFWVVWSGFKANIYSLFESDVDPPLIKRPRVEGSGPGPEQPLDPVQVFVDLWLKDSSPDEALTYLIKKVRGSRGLLNLCCRKLKIFGMPIQNVQKILRLVQLDSIQEFEVNSTWRLTTLGKFAPQLGKMGGLRRLFVYHIHSSPRTSQAVEERCVSLFSSQLLNLHHLRGFYVDSVSFLKDRLVQVLRCLKTPLDSLSFTNCLLSESDLMHLAQGLNVTKLKALSLSGVSLTNVSSEPLRVLLERASDTLQDLDLEECGIVDAQFTAMLPALSCCSQLVTFSLCGNRLSMASLEDLLHHTIGLSKLSRMLYPAPLESYEDVRGTLHLGVLAQLHARLRQLLEELGLPSIVWFSASPCPHCGDRTFYDPEPILCPCSMPD